RRPTESSRAGLPLLRCEGKARRRDAMKNALLAAVLVSCVVAVAQTTMPSADVLGSHDLSVAPISGTNSAACLYCHAPHSGIGGRTPLWAQQLSVQSYTMYSSTTMQNKTDQPVLGAQSSLCLSCHDGTVAPGTEVPYGVITLQTQMTGGVIGTKLIASHPF